MRFIYRIGYKWGDYTNAISRSRKILLRQVRIFKVEILIIYHYDEEYETFLGILHTSHSCFEHS
jgi:hypothetical protein